MQDKKLSVNSGIIFGEPILTSDMKGVCFNKFNKTSDCLFEIKYTFFLGNIGSFVTIIFLFI